MPLTPDPRRRWRLAFGAELALAICGLAGSVYWAFGPRSDLPLIVAGTSSAVPSIQHAVVDPQVFQLSLWRPFVDRPVGLGTAEAPPPSIKLFSIFKRQGKLVAALEISGTEGLAYFSSGQTQGVIKVISIETTAVSLLVDGKPLRLGLSP